METIYSWPAEHAPRARTVAQQLTRQNRAGRQADGCPPREFTARVLGTRVYLMAWPV